MRPRLLLRALAARRPAPGFATQIALAHELDLALVIHARDAFDDLFDLLASEGVPARTVIHCFTGTPDDAEGCLALGCDISVSGVVTFKNADSLRDAVRIGAARPAPRRDRQPVPRARSPPGPGQRTGLRQRRRGVRRANCAAKSFGDVREATARATRPVCSTFHHDNYPLTRIIEHLLRF